MPKNEKFPEIRFDGYTNEWSKCRLGEIVEVCSGRDYKHLSEGNIPVYGTGGYMLSVDEALSYNKDAVGIGRKGTIDQPYLLKAPFWTVDTLFYVFPRDEFDLNFVYDIFQNVEWEKEDESTGVPSLSKLAINRIEILFPQYKEQVKIGVFLSSLDKFISDQKRKYDQLVNMKSSLLEKMFPHDGAKVPEIRFNGFEDDWHQHKLGEMGTLKNGMNFTKDAMGKGFPFVNLQNIFGRNVIDDKNLGLAQATEDQLCEYDLKEGDVLFVRSSVKLEGVGEAAIIPRDLKNTTYSGFIIRFRDNIGLEKNFKRVIFATQSVRKQIMAQATDSANKNISQTSLENLEVFTPNFEEQQKIGQLFANIDNVISAQQQKIEQLKNIKQSFIDKMFVS